MIEKYLTFIESHWRLVLGLGVLVVVLYLGNRFLDNQHDELVGKNAVAQQQLAEQVKQNQQLAAQVEVQKQEYAKLAAQLQAQNKLLLSAIQSRSQQTTDQQARDATLSQEALALRWSQLISVPFEEIKVDNGRLSASGQAALKTTQTLEEVAPLQATVKDQTTIIANKDQQLTSLTSLNTGLAAQITGLNKQIVDQNNACTTQVKLIKSNARRSKFKYFIGGAVTGAVLVAKLVLF